MTRGERSRQTIRTVAAIIPVAGIVSVLASGCIDPKSPPAAPGPNPSVHARGWSDPASPEFHGTVLAARAFDVTSCRQCHGNGYDGGLVGVSCRDCHASFPHPESWVEAHPGFLKNRGWDLAACRDCHGASYDRVKLDYSCRTCHTQPGGPESCNTCHGNSAADASDLANAAPPVGLDGETDPGTPAVGAHRPHLVASGLPAAEMCRECHVVPATFAAAGHVDAGGRAEVTFGGGRSTTATESGARVPSPSYDTAAGTCSSMYCHGNWALLKSASGFPFVYSGAKIEGNSAAPTWTDRATGACGSCHGLPPTGHDPAAISACAGCHEGVVDGAGAILDPTLHVNGRVNVFGMEYPMF